MPPHTAIFVSSNSPRSRKAAIRIQAAFRGYACRKFFQMSVTDELLEELMETEEWERDELVHWEEQEVEALQDRARQLALSHPMPSPTQTLRRSHSQIRSQESEEPLSGGTSLHATVRGFCSSMDHLLRGDFQTEALKDFLPPSWRRRWWDIAEDSPDPSDQLDAIEDCVTFMAAKVKEVVTGVLKLEPLTATSPLRGQVDHFLGFEDRLESSAAAIQQELCQLVGKCPVHDVPVPVQQQLTDFQRHLQREKDCVEEGAYLHGVLELPATAGAETKFQRQRRLRRGSPNARPSSAGSTGSTDSVGDSASDLLARFQRWRTACVERACERWRAVLQRREANLAQTMALFTSIQQSLAGGPFGHIPAAGTPLLNSAQPLNTDPKRGLKDREGAGHHPYKFVATHSGEGWLQPTGNCGAVPRTFTGSLGTFSPHVVIGWEDPPATWPSGALPHFEDVVKPSRAHHALAPLKAKAKLALDQKAVDAATELHLQEASLTSADGLDMYRNAPMFMAAMPT